jgi:ABC-type phosphate transport system substrate-binding protein
LATTPHRACLSAAGPPAKWSADYNVKTGNKVNYQSIGSGGGLAQIKAGTVDFGASDAPMKPEELQKLGMGQFPLVIGGIVPVVNIEGVQEGQIRFTGPLLADIYLGKIKNWNDPETIKPEQPRPGKIGQLPENLTALGKLFAIVRATNRNPAQRKLLQEERTTFEREWSAAERWTLLALPQTKSR